MATAATLDDLIENLRAESDWTREEQKDGFIKTTDRLDEMIDTNRLISTSVNAFIDFLRGDKLLQLEKIQEQNRFNENLLSAIQGIKLEPEDKKQDDDSSGIFGIIAATMLFLRDTITGTFKGITKALIGAGKLLIKPFTFLTDRFWSFAKVFGRVTGLGVLFDTLFSSFGRLTSGLEGVRSSVMAKLSAYGDDLARLSSGFVERLKAPFSAFTGATTRLGTAINAIADWFKGSVVGSGVDKLKTAATGFISRLSLLFEGITSIGRSLAKIPMSIFETIRGAVSSIGGYIKSFGAGISEVASKFGFIGSLLRFVLVPLTVIVTLYQTIKEAMAGFKEDGIGGAITGAIKGLWSALVGGLLDMIKSLISWTTEKLFGENAFSQLLDSFSIDQAVRDMIDWVADSISKLFNTIFDTIGKVWENLTDGFDMGQIFSDLGATFDALMNLIKSTISDWLPDPDSLVGRVIPDSLYDWVDSDTPSLVQPREAPLTPTEEIVTQESAQMRRAAPPIVSVVDGSSNQTSNNVDSSQQVITINQGPGMIDRMSRRFKTD